jgi:hypothetical protein
MMTEDACPDRGSKLLLRWLIHQRRWQRTSFIRIIAYAKSKQSPPAAGGCVSARTQCGRGCTELSPIHVEDPRIPNDYEHELSA